MKISKKEAGFGQKCLHELNNEIDIKLTKDKHEKKPIMVPIAAKFTTFAPFPLKII